MTRWLACRALRASRRRLAPRIKGRADDGAHHIVLKRHERGRYSHGRRHFHRFACPMGRSCSSAARRYRESLSDEPSLMQPDHNNGVKPLFTIAIPTFNRAEWLGRCVRSALAQTHSSFEVLVSDNASDDATPQVLAKFSDSRMVTIRQVRNIGPIANWNACVEHARGEFIVMLSDDDLLAPYFLSRCGELVDDRTTPVQVIVALGDVVDPDTGWMNPASQSRALCTGIRRGTDVLSEFLRGAISPQMCTVAVRTESLRDAGGFPQGWQHAGDLAAWVPLLLDGDAGFVNDVCGTHSTHASAQTAGMSLDTRLREFDRLGRVLAGGTLKIDDRPTAAMIARLTRRYVARNLLGHIGSERTGGVSRRAVATTAWRWRHRLVDLGAADLRVTLRPIALFLTPSWVVAKMRRIKRGLARRASLAGTP
jgi:glycosyltransferase involved in cell wall biosynthesis